MVKKETIGNILKRIRNEKGLSQAKLGELIGVKVTSISRWEVGRVLPNLETAIKLANVLEVSMDVFCGLNDTEVSNLELLAKKACKLPKNKILALEVVLKTFLV